MCASKEIEGKCEEVKRKEKEEGDEEEKEDMEKKEGKEKGKEKKNKDKHIRGFQFSIISPSNALEQHQRDH